MMCGRLLRVSSVYCLNRDADVDLDFNSLATLFFPAAFCPPLKMHQPPNKRPDENSKPLCSGKGVWTDSWSIRLDWDTGGYLEIFLKGKKK